MLAVVERGRPDYGVGYYQKRYGSYIALWLRVYIRAAFDYVQYRKSKSIKLRREYETARHWLFDDEGGLDSVCALFSLPLEPLRQRALAMTRKDVKKLEHLERDGLLIRSLDRPMENTTGGFGL